MPFSYATVVDTCALSSRLRRIVLQVEDSVALDVKSAADSAVGVYFSDEGPDSESQDGRNYSVRRHDGDLLTLDFVLHGHGPATTWASNAQPGDRVGLDHARSWYRPEPSADWQLLASDLSGLPATARILEELPAGSAVTAIVEVAHDDDLAYLPKRDDVSVIASVGTGNGIAPSTLAQRIREYVSPGGRGYCWFAGEAAESRKVRKYLRGLGWTIDQYDVTGYWRHDSETWDAKFAEVSDDVLVVYERALSDGKGDKVAFEEFDDACERIGL